MSNPIPQAITSRLLGTAVHTTKRTLSEGYSVELTTKKADRSKLALKEYTLLANYAKKGLGEEEDEHFKMLMTGDGRDDLQEIYDAGLRVEQLRKSLQEYDMEDVFILAGEFTTDTNGDSVPVANYQLVDLLTQYNVLDYELVKLNLTYFWEFGEDYHVENLKWSREKILRSYETALRQTIEE